MSTGKLSLQSLAADFAILRAENATLKARADKSDARADKSDAENADLKAKVEELIKANSTSSTVPPPPPEEELMTRYSSRWRLLFFIGGTIPSAFAVYGYVKDDERLSWAAATFYAFSVLCLLGVALGNPQNIQSWKEKLFVVICAGLIGLSPFIGGLKAITVVEHQATVYFGWFCVDPHSLPSIPSTPNFLPANYQMPSRRYSSHFPISWDRLFSSLPLAPDAS